MKSSTASRPAATASAPASASTRQRRKEARPQELLDAALELFVERGFSATRSEDVAARAGVSKGTLYLYYPSKEELLKAVVRENLGALIREGQDIAGGFDGDTQQLLALLMHTWWERIGATPASGIFKIILTEMGNFPDFARFYIDEVIEPARELFTRVLQRGVDAGELRRVNLFEAVHLLIFPMLMMCLHRHSIGPCQVPGRQLDPHRFIDTHIDTVVNGLRRPARAEAAPPPRKAVTR
ncbi:MAG TPA: TetR/AcrR family transcriptional regulator [Burkholderiaceae bacterium]|nr:TetR/AcrR family transcriptional regulator [Burkholderiaceae bacterium]